MTPRFTIFTESIDQMQVLGERGDILIYAAPDGVPFFGIESDGRAGGDLVGATREPDKDYSTTE